MKKIYVKLLFLLCLVLLISCFHYQDAMTYIKSSFQLSREYIVKVKTQTKTLEVSLEDYLVGVLAGEMPVSFELEALKAQAVASRTFVLSRKLNVDNTTSSQVYLSDEQMQKNWGSHYQEYKDKIKEAIKQTSYEVMMYQGEYISALFFSSSNGKTVNCEDYFTGEVAYLKSVDSHWDEEIDPTYKRTKTFTQTSLANIFQVSSLNMNITSYTNSGYVKEVIVNGKSYSGREIREKLGLASSCFQMQLTSNGYIFTTYGNGHGVGMSQYGAEAMAKEKKSYRDILNHYYQNIEIKRIDL